MEYCADGSPSRFRALVLSCMLLGFVLSCFLLVTPAALAQEPEQPAPEKKEEGGEVKDKLSQNPIAHFFQSIGLVFGVIFATISIAMVALIIVLALDLRMGEAVPASFVDDFTGMVNKRQFKQAFELSKNDGSFLARVLTAGMARLQYGIEDARESMLSMVDTVRAGKENWISYLATIGTLGPLLGLVGTVSGMIGAFRKLGSGGNAPNAADLAGEISHALVVTLVGVAVAVPAIFFYQFFKSRLINITMSSSNLADDLLTQMYHNSKKAAEGKSGEVAVKPAEAKPPEGQIKAAAAPR